MLDLDPHKIEVHFALDHVPQVEYVLLILELDMQTLLYPYLELYGDWRLRGRQLLEVLDEEDLLLLDLAVVPSDGHLDEVLETALDALVGLIGFLDVLEVEVISHIIAEGAGGFEFSGQVEELEVLGFVVGIFDDADQFDSDAHVFDGLSFLQIYADFAVHVFFVLLVRLKLP